MWGGKRISQPYYKGKEVMVVEPTSGAAGEADRENKKGKKGG